MTEQNETSIPDSPSRAQGAGFFFRLWRALVRTILALVVIAALALGGWFGFKELRRSFDVVDQRIDRHAETLQAQQQRIDLLATRLATADAATLALDGTQRSQATAMAGAAAQREDAVAGVQAELDALRLEAETRAQSASALTDAIAALQADITAANSDLDVLGGTVDGMVGDIAALREQNGLQGADLTAFDEALATADLDALRQTIALFRVWEMVSRARLRLLENNAGLAAADVARAQAIVAALIAGETFADETPLALIAQRLDFAAANLPASPEAAATDLDLTWEALDRLLSARLDLTPLPSDAVATPPAPNASATDAAVTPALVTPMPASTATPAVPPAVTPTATPDS